MPLTLISHLWNEEFLLPYWLRHHYPLFDHGVLLDYGSTDRSLDIIQEMAPRWKVRRSRNEWFDAQDIDVEVMDVERAFSGWKMVLNTTEFLLCHDLPLFVRWMEKYRPDVRGVWAFDLTMVDPLEERDREVTEAPLYFQKRWGYQADASQSRSRLLHKFPDGRYAAGRHSTCLLPCVPDDSLFVLWFGWCPMRHVKERKLRIQQRVSARDRALGLGRQHLISPEGLEAAYRQEAAKARDLWQTYPAYGELIRTLACREGVSL